MSETMLVVGEALTDCSKRADSITETPGGSPMNVAVGIGRLGHSILLAARVGNDPRGVAILDHARASNVALIDEVNGLPRTSSATATIAPDGSASYEFDLLWDIRESMLPAMAFSHVHTGSIGATLEPGSTGVLEILTSQREAGASISYDPNARPSIMGTAADVLPRMEAIIGLSHIVKASDEDIAWLYPDRDEERVVQVWRDLGPSLVVLTRGAEGVLAFAGPHRVSLPTQAEHVEDTIGAGDSFMAGLLVALQERGYLGSGVDRVGTISRADLVECVDYALSCAAITVSRVGANPPTRAELEAFS
jgi:fructokinase